MATDPERKQRIDLNNTPCPICGQAYYEWGYPKGHGGARIRFSDKPGLDWMITGDKMRARKCLLCGNVQLFAMD